MKQNISRREFLRVVGLVSSGAALAACTPQVVTQVVTQVMTQMVQSTVVQTVEVQKQVTQQVMITPTPMTGPTNALGLALPPDALPLDQQYALISVGTVGGINTGSLGFEMDSVYNKAYVFGVGGEVMTQIDMEGNCTGIACESWKLTPDGMAWDFTLRKELVFSDGKPVTAKDWVATFQRSFGNGYDFGWMYADILNANDVLAGKKTPDQLGVEAVDDFTFRVHTATFTPYIPAVFSWAYVGPSQAYQQYGNNWSITPSQFITAGPWMLTEFNRGVAYTFALNPKYKGILKVYISEIRARSLPTGLNAYITGEVQTYSIGSSSPADEINRVNSDPVLRAESHPAFSNITWYAGFNTLGKFKELTNHDVRLALNKAIDKTTIINAVLGGFAYPAWGILPKGFIGNSYAALSKEDPNIFDVAAAQKHLADAGFPNGQGFPTFEMHMRAPGNPGSFYYLCCEAIQQAWKTNLNINVKLVPEDYSTFTKSVFTDKIEPMYFIAYSMDYWDPADFLGVFRTGSRHPWSNPDYDKAFADGNIIQDPTKRFAGLAAAEKILVDDCGFLFFTCSFATNLWPCNIAGKWVAPNSEGYSNFNMSPYGGVSQYDGFYFTNSTCRDSLKKS